MLSLWGLQKLSHKLQFVSIRKTNRMLYKDVMAVLCDKTGLRSLDIQQHLYVIFHRLDRTCFVSEVTDIVTGIQCFR
jgi:hypothetical protein